MPAGISDAPTIPAGWPLDGVRGTDGNPVLRHSRSYVFASGHVPVEDAPGEDKPEGSEGPCQIPAIRILVVDDHAMVRSGLAQLLGRQTGFEVVGCASDGQEAVKMTEQLRPDVVLMDVVMPRMDGVQATRLIKLRFPQVRVVGLSMHSDGAVAASMMQAGAVRYLVKNGPLAGMMAAIRACM